MTTVYSHWRASDALARRTGSAAPRPARTVSRQRDDEGGIAQLWRHGTSWYAAVWVWGSVLDVAIGSSRRQVETHYKAYLKMFRREQRAYQAWLK